MRKMGLEWNCKICTYRHLAPAKQCVMCGSDRLDGMAQQQICRDTWSNSTNNKGGVSSSTNSNPNKNGGRKRPLSQVAQPQIGGPMRPSSTSTTSRNDASSSIVEIVEEEGAANSNQKTTKTVAVMNQSQRPKTTSAGMVRTRSFVSQPQDKRPPSATASSSSSAQPAFNPYLLNKNNVNVGASTRGNTSSSVVPTNITNSNSTVSIMLPSDPISSQRQRGLPCPSDIKRCDTWNAAKASRPGNQERYPPNQAAVCTGGGQARGLYGIHGGAARPSTALISTMTPSNSNSSAQQSRPSTASRYVNPYAKKQATAISSTHSNPYAKNQSTQAVHTAAAAGTFASAPVLAEQDSSCTGSICNLFANEEENMTIQTSMTTPGGGSHQGHLANTNTTAPQQEHFPPRQAAPLQQTVPATRIQKRTTTPSTLADSSSKRQKPSNTTNIHETKSNPWTHSSRPVYTPPPVKMDVDAEIAGTYIYPENPNHPSRKYQEEIVRTALVDNTLVSLPTGLGKTLIAAVVMYNYHRWFAKDGGLTVFCAPTRSLVTQQIEACYNIMGIPVADTAEITGAVKKTERPELWKTRKMFFCTPQTLYQDLKDGTVDGSKIVCLVLDETHRATGQYSYATVIPLLESLGARPRIVGLSATPGKDIKAIQAVIETLRTSRIEVRLEDEPEVKKHLHQRNVEINVVDSIPEIELMGDYYVTHFVEPILKPLYESSFPLKINRCPSKVSSGSIMVASHDFASRGITDGFLKNVFCEAMQICAITDKFNGDGINSAWTALINLRQKVKRRGTLKTLLDSDSFKKLKKDMNDYIKNKHKTRVNDKVPNPKLKRLEQVLVEHFERKKSSNQDTRVIVFSQRRLMVDEICQTLRSTSPMIKARHFVGQAKGSSSKGKSADIEEDGEDLSDSDNIIDEENEEPAVNNHPLLTQGNAEDGMSTKQQQEAIRDFREGKYNTLVCTCIGEEGLDIGEVDLIVNFDVVKSAIRNTQRVGRTGRKRDGRVVSIIAKSELETHHQQATKKRTLDRALKQSSKFKMCQPPSIFNPDYALPTVIKQQMVIPGEFRLSQVGGHKKKKPPKSKTNKAATSKGKKKHMGDSDEWKLSEAREQERHGEFGDRLGYVDNHNGFYVDDYDNTMHVHIFSDKLRQKYLRERRLPNTDADADLDAQPLGTSNSILRAMHTVFGRENDRQIYDRRRLRALQQERSCLITRVPCCRRNTPERLDPDSRLSETGTTAAATSSGTASLCAESGIPTSSSATALATTTENDAQQRVADINASFALASAREGSAPKNDSPANRASACLDQFACVSTTGKFSSTTTAGSSGDNSRSTLRPSSRVADSALDTSVNNFTPRNEELPNVTDQSGPPSSRCSSIHSSPPQPTGLNRSEGQCSEQTERCSMVVEAAPVIVNVRGTTVNAAERIENVADMGQNDDKLNNVTPLVSLHDASHVNNCADRTPISVSSALHLGQTAATCKSDPHSDTPASKHDHDNLHDHGVIQANGKANDTSEIAHELDQDMDSSGPAQGLADISFQIPSQGWDDSSTSSSEGEVERERSEVDYQSKNQDDAPVAGNQFVFVLPPVEDSDEKSVEADTQEAKTSPQLPVNNFVFALPDADDDSSSSSSYVSDTDDEKEGELGNGVCASKNNGNAPQNTSHPGDHTVILSCPQDPLENSQCSLFANRKLGSLYSLRDPPAFRSSEFENRVVPGLGDVAIDGPGYGDETALKGTSESQILCQTSNTFTPQKTSNKNKAKGNPLLSLDGDNEYDSDEIRLDEDDELAVGRNAPGACDSRTNESTGHALFDTPVLQQSNRKRFSRTSLAQHTPPTENTNGISQELLDTPNNEPISCSRWFKKTTPLGSSKGTTADSPVLCDTPSQEMAPPRKRKLKHKTNLNPFLSQPQHYKTTGRDSDSDATRLDEGDDSNFIDLAGHSDKDNIVTVTNEFSKQSRRHRKSTAFALENLSNDLRNTNTPKQTTSREEFCCFADSPTDVEHQDVIELKKTKRLRRGAKQEKAPPLQFSDEAQILDTPMSVVHAKQAQLQKVKEKMARRNKAVRWFVEDQAAIDSEDDVEGDDDEEQLLRDIEDEEELHDEFINDSSQLGCMTQDPLDLLNEQTQSQSLFYHQHETGAIHHQVDNAHAASNHLTTPILNRRMMRRKGTPPTSPTSSQMSDSQGSSGGLGDMGFIRSVLEHHRQGGDCDQVESEYCRLEESLVDTPSSVQSSGLTNNQEQAYYIS
jgi:ERCC4-related helicase